MALAHETNRPLRLALIGYGKMGQAVEAAALTRGHAIVARIEADGAAAIQQLDRSSVDVAIDFTHPDVVLDHIQAALAQGLPLVVGTTGWTAHQAAVAQWVAAAQGSLLYGSNFSIGVNLMFAMNRILARLMAPHTQYDVALEEHHHRHKADSPSGTARTLAQDILAHLPRKTQLADPAALTSRAPAPHELTVGVIRAGEIPGTHTVRYASATDTLILTHTAHNRSGFAEGAVTAAEWLTGKQGFYDFSMLFSAEGLQME